METLMNKSPQGSVAVGSGGGSLRRIPSKLNPNAKEWKPPAAVEEENICKTPPEAKLNPNAEEWEPASEDERTLYFTFSNGHPLTHRDIYLFFNTNYGVDVVEKVYINQQNEEVPMWGKIVLKSFSSMVQILQRQEKVTFCINGKPICCKKFTPKKKTANA